MNKNAKPTGKITTEFAEDFRKRSNYYGYDHFGTNPTADGIIDPNSIKLIDLKRFTDMVDIMDYRFQGH